MVYVDKKINITQLCVRYVANGVVQGVVGGTGPGIGRQQITL